MKISNSKGQAMMAAVVVLGVVALVFIAAVVYKSMVSSKSNAQSASSISAYEVANGAVQKGIWALNLNTDNWDLVGDGGVLDGYDGGTVLTDIPGGKYKLAISSGPGADDRTIVAYAKDNSTKPQYRGLKVVMSKSSSQFGAVMGYKIKLQKRAKVHWGPIYAYDELNVHKKARVFYPQLFSKGKIKHIDNNSSLPNTDGKRWWSFNYPPGVPSWPQIDFEYYKALAQSQGTYYSKDDRKKGKKHKDDDSDKLDDKDKSDDDEYSYQNVIDTRTYVRYYDTGVKAKFKGGKNLLRGVIIAMGKLKFQDATASVADVNAKYTGLGLTAYYPRTVSIPTDAWEQYQKIDTSSVGDYPGDIGGPGASGQSATYTFGASSADEDQTDAPIHFEGFIYAGDKLILHRGGVIVGVVMAAHKTTKLESSEDDKDSDSDNKDRDQYDNCDRVSDHDDKSDDKDRHEDPGDLSTHRDQSDCRHANAHKKRLTIYYQDNLNIRVIGSGTTQKSWQEVPVTPF